MLKEHDIVLFYLTEILVLIPVYILSRASIPNAVRQNINKATYNTKVCQVLGAEKGWLCLAMF